MLGDLLQTPEPSSVEEFTVEFETPLGISVLPARNNGKGAVVVSVQSDFAKAKRVRAGLYILRVGGIEVHNMPYDSKGQNSVLGIIRSARMRSTPTKVTFGSRLPPVKTTIGDTGILKLLTLKPQFKPKDEEVLNHLEKIYNIHIPKAIWMMIKGLLNLTNDDPICDIRRITLSPSSHTVKAGSENSDWGKSMIFERNDDSEVKVLTRPYELKFHGVDKKVSGKIRVFKVDGHETGWLQFQIGSDIYIRARWCDGRITSCEVPVWIKSLKKRGMLTKYPRTPEEKYMVKLDENVTVYAGIDDIVLYSLMVDPTDRIGREDSELSVDI